MKRHHERKSPYPGRCGNIPQTVALTTSLHCTPCNDHSALCSMIIASAIPFDRKLRSNVPAVGRRAGSPAGSHGLRHARADGPQLESRAGQQLAQFRGVPAGLRPVPGRPAPAAAGRRATRPPAGQQPALSAAGRRLRPQPGPGGGGRPGPARYACICRVACWVVSTCSSMCSAARAAA